MPSPNPPMMAVRMRGMRKFQMTSVVRSLPCPNRAAMTSRGESPDEPEQTAQMVLANTTRTHAASTIHLRKVYFL